MSEGVREIRARLDAATPGPWVVSRWLDGRGGSKPMVAARGVTVAITHPAPVCDTEQCEANAELIANAPTDIHHLLDRVERLETWVRRAGNVVDYVDATIAPNNCRERRGDWVEVHAGRAFSSHNQLRAVRDESRALLSDATGAP